MRYFGKQGPQCKPADRRAESKYSSQARLMAHSVLFGRVTASAVRWLGLGVAIICLMAVIYSLGNLHGSHAGKMRDPASAVMIRH
jgi:hypothetical protein